MGHPAKGAVTDGVARYAFEQKLRAERARLWQEATAVEGQLEVLAEQREPEFEDAAQRRQMLGELAQLDLRSKREIEEIDAALMRLADGGYGSCQSCGRRIAIARLEVLPATRFCVRCAAQPRPQEE